MRDYIDYLIYSILPNGPRYLIVIYKKKILLRVTLTMSNMLTIDAAEFINVIYFIIQLNKVGFELLFIGINGVIFNIF